MRARYLYIANKEWFENSSLADPIAFMDHKLETIYPALYRTDYDLKLLVTHAPTEAEKSSPIYNNCLERYGSTDIDIFKDAAQSKQAKNVFLNGFRQEHFEYIAPFIKDTVEILYLFKCRWIKDISVLSEFKKLKCVFIFGNNSLEALWDMKNNKNLAVISFVNVTRLREINFLRQSTVEYITFDSSDNNGNKRDFLIDDIEFFNEVPRLKHLKLVYKKCDVNY